MRRASSVRYGPGDNSALRFALWEAWKRKCYLCRKPVEFDSCQIDHIIAKDVSDGRLRHLKGHFGLPDGFDLHDPHNLAPICAPCNGPAGKANTTSDAPVVLIQLDRAAKYRPAVVARVEGFGRSGKVAEHLLQVITTDLSQREAREEFLELAPAVVQILAMAGGSADHLSFERLEIEVDTYGSEQGVNVSLDERGRTAKALLAEVCEADLGSALRGPVVQLLREVDTRVVKDLQSLHEDNPFCAGPPVSDWFVVDVESLDFRREGRFVEFTVRGAFEGSLSASLTRSDSRGDGLEDLQGDVVVAGSFSTSMFWDLAAALSGLEAGDCLIDEWKLDTFSLL
ncbi:HNH endonuclease [Kitasatospora sp. NPDC088346]|uniref:HNH endonuclease n=1 Tax=Kitasatospora sp. NPDC088346 TaxID=3364073 RepID=UPI0037F9A904